MNGEDLGKLLLRIAVGGLLVLHGFAKLRHGVGPIAGMVTAKGLPSFFAYGVYLGEVVAPILVVIGTLTRPAAMVMAINMVVALALYHTGTLFSLGKAGGFANELAFLYLVGALAIALLGSGRYAVSRGASRWD